MKKYVRQTVGDEYNVPTIAVLRSPEEVDTFDFPARCCIKPTHASTHVMPARQRRAHRPRAHQEMVCDELLPLRARAELPLAEAEGDRRAADLRHHQRRGLQDLLLARRAQVREVDIDRYTNHTRKFFDTEWNEQDFSITLSARVGCVAEARHARRNARRWRGR